MKKVTLSLLCFVAALLFVNTGYAQLNLKNKATIGFSFSDLSKNPSGETQAKPGFQLGGSVMLGKKFFFEPGVFYSVKSTEFPDPDNNSVNLEAVIKGLRIPVAVGYQLLGGEDETFGLRIFGGGSGYFVLATGDDIDKDDIESPSWGTYAGAGIDIWKLFLDVSYEWSLTDVQKDISQIDFGKHRSLFINVGFMFSF